MLNRPACLIRLLTSCLSTFQLLKKSLWKHSWVYTRQILTGSTLNKSSKTSTNNAVFAYCAKFTAVNCDKNFEDATLSCIEATNFMQVLFLRCWSGWSGALVVESAQSSISVINIPNYSILHCQKLFNMPLLPNCNQKEISSRKFNVCNIRLLIQKINCWNSTNLHKAVHIIVCIKASKPSFVKLKYMCFINISILSEISRNF